MDRTLTPISESGILPVVVFDDPDDAPALPAALIEGPARIAVAQITRTAIAVARRTRGRR